MKTFRLTTVVIMVLALALPLLAEDGAALYKSKCAGCHAADGSGSPMGQKLGAKPLSDAATQKLSDADLEKVITGGKGKMSGFKSLTPDQVKALIAQIRSFAKK